MSSSSATPLNFIEKTGHEANYLCALMKVHVSLSYIKKINIFYETFYQVNDYNAVLAVSYYAGALSWSTKLTAQLSNIKRIWLARSGHYNVHFFDQLIFENYR